MSVKERILEAGVATLLERGIASLTGPRVARAAGVSQSHLTYYFPTRNQLLLAVANRAMDLLFALFESIEEIEGTISFQRLANSPDLLNQTRMITGLIVASDTDPELHDALSGMFAGVRTRIEKMLPQLGITPTRENALQFHAGMVGLVVMNFARRTPESLQDVVNGLQLIVQSLRNQSNK